MTTILETATHAGESGHWYTQDGKQVTLVEGVRGQRLAPTLVHARKLNLGPGVTTIMKAGGTPPGLERWKLRQSVLSALTLPRRDGEWDAAYLSRIAADGRAQARKAAEIGIEIHAAVQEDILGMAKPSRWTPWVEAIRKELAYRSEPDDTYLSEWSCSHQSGYGTKADVVVPDRWLVDIKTKDSLDGVRVWAEHAMQLAATSKALEEHNLKVPRHAILFVSRNEPECKWVTLTPQEIERGWEMFQHLLGFWQAKNRHYPDWSEVPIDIEEESSDKPYDDRAASHWG